MAERDDAPEGWGVRQRPAVIAALGVPTALVLALWAAAHFYNKDLRPATKALVHSFPAPGVETFIHDGGQDPERPRVVTHPDRAIQAAKRTVVADGLADWNAPK